MTHCVCLCHREREEEVKSPAVLQGVEADSLDGNDGTAFSFSDIVQR